MLFSSQVINEMGSYVPDHGIPPGSCGRLRDLNPISQWKTCLKRRLKKPKIGFQDQLSLNASPREHSAILSTFIKSYHLSLRPLFSLFLSGPFRQVLQYSGFKLFATLTLFIKEFFETVNFGEKSADN